MEALPPSGVRKPVSIFMVVDLPAPFGPRKPRTSPGFTSKDRLSTATWSPKRLVRLFIFIMASSISPGILARRNQARAAKRKDTLITSAREKDISGLHWFRRYRSITRANRCSCGEQIILPFTDMGISLRRFKTRLYSGECNKVLKNGRIAARCLSFQRLPMPSAQPSLFSRLRFGLMRRLLYLWARSESIGNPLAKIAPASGEPILYVLPGRSYSDLLVLDQECRRAGLPRPVMPPSGALEEESAYFHLTSELAWSGRPDPRKRSPRLLRALTAVELRVTPEVKIVLVSVFWGLSPDAESSPLKLLFAHNWGVGGKLRKLLAILVHGRKIRVSFGEPLSLRELADENLGHNRNLRKVSRLLRVHFKQQRGAVVGPDLSYRRTLLKGLM